METACRPHLQGYLGPHWVEIFNAKGLEGLVALPKRREGGYPTGLKRTGLRHNMRVENNIELFEQHIVDHSLHCKLAKWAAEYTKTAAEVSQETKQGIDT